MADRKLVDAAIEEARRVVDAQEMADMPHCQLDPVVTDAGLLHFCERKDISVALRNTGTVRFRLRMYKISNNVVASHPFVSSDGLHSSPKV